MSPLSSSGIFVLTTSAAVYSAIGLAFGTISAFRFGIGLAHTFSGNKFRVFDLKMFSSAVTERSS
jgi:hypothetical protein